MAEDHERAVVRQVREQTQALESLLHDFSDRLRRMRQRNRELQEEIASFEGDLARLRKEVLDAESEFKDDDEDTPD